MPAKAAREPTSAPAPAAHPAAGTLTRIAADAGVSVSTVSKVLNGRTDVSADTRERIGQLLRKHGYQPGSSLGFGVVDLLLGVGEWTMSAGHDPWAEELIHGTVQAASEAGHSVLVTSVSSAAEFGRWLAQATARGHPRGAERPAPAARRRAQAARGGGHPGRRHRSRGGTGRGRQVGRHDKLAGRPQRHPPPHRARPYPHRGDRRARGPVVQPGAAGRTPGRHAGGWPDHG